MRRFLEQFNASDPSEEFKERQETLEFLQRRIAVMTRDLDEARSANYSTVSEMEERYKAEVEAEQHSLCEAKAQLEEMTDEEEYWKQEIFILQDKVAKAEAGNRDLVKSLQQPKDWESVTEADGSLEYYRKELIASRQIEANLKGLIAAKKLLLEDSRREKEDLEGLLRLKDQQLAAVSAETELQSQTQELQTLQRKVEELRETQTQQPAAPVIADLDEQIQSTQRAIESLLTEKSSLVLQLETFRSEPEEQRTKPRGSRMASMKLFRRHRNVRKVVEVVDDLVCEIQALTDDQAIVKLGIVLYMFVLHLWVFLSAVDVRGCRPFMS